MKSIVGRSVLAKQMPTNCLPSHMRLIYQFNRAVNWEKCSPNLNSELQANNRQQALMQNWKYKYLWNTAYLTFSFLSAAHGESDRYDFQLHDTILQFWWQGLVTLMCGAFALVCREYPCGIHYILFYLKQKGASTKELKTALQCIKTWKNPLAI